MIDHGRDTALLGAIQEGYSNIVDVLIEYEADVNRKWSSLTLMAELNMCCLHVAFSVL